MHIHVYVNYFSMSLSIFNVENLCSSSLYTFYCQHICNNNTNIIINHNKLHYSPKHGIFIFHFYFLSHGNAFGKSYYSYIHNNKNMRSNCSYTPEAFYDSYSQIMALGHNKNILSEMILATFYLWWAMFGVISMPNLHFKQSISIWVNT